MEKLKIAIGIPHIGTIKMKTMVDFVRAIKCATFEWNLLTQQGSYIQDNRESIAKAAKDLGHTHLMFIDHDMTFQQDAINKLIDRKKDIIGVNFNMRTLPLMSTVKDTDPNDGKLWEEHGELIKCIAVPTGFMLINMKVFDNILHPWFNVTSDEKGKLVYGEDMWFCRQARKAGYDIWLDTKIEVKHIGDYEY